MHKIEFNADRDMNEFIFGDMATPNLRMNYLRKINTGIAHNHKLVPICPKDGETCRVQVSVAHDDFIQRVVCHLHSPTDLTIEMKPKCVEWDTLNWRYIQIWEGVIPAFREGSQIKYQVKALPKNGQPINADNAVFSYTVGSHAPPAWTKDVIMYQVFLDRFHPGDEKVWNETTSMSDIFGGTLSGLLDKLDYILDLGFNTILLNPFFLDDTSHGYHCYDHFTVNPRLGTEAELRELVDTLHRRGCKLVLDFVANHWSKKHPTFQEASQNKDSQYYDWYHWIDWPHDYHTFFGVMDLPKLNIENQGVRDHLIKIAKHWVDFGFDGLRLDYALGPSHDFWTEFRTALKGQSSDVWIFGEAVSDPSTMRSYLGRFDGCLDFITLQSLRDTFAYGTKTVEELAVFLEHHYKYFPEDFDLICFLDNHDMNRFNWLAKDESVQQKNAAFCQFTMPSIPLVYYGSEVGVKQYRDVIDARGRHIMEESRVPMAWGEDQDFEIRQFYANLVKIRHAYPELRYGKLHTVHVDAKSQSWAYSRTMANQSVLCSINSSDQAVEIEVNSIAVVLKANCRQIFNLSTDTPEVAIHEL